MLEKCLNKRSMLLRQMDIGTKKETKNLAKGVECHCFWRGEFENYGLCVCVCVSLILINIKSLPNLILI